MEGAVGGHFDDDVRLDTGDVERAAVEMSGADAGRPWMFTGGGGVRTVASCLACRVDRAVVRPTMTSFPVSV